MSNPRSFTIHKSKKSLVDKMLTARQSLIASISTLDHRLEQVTEINGVSFINDSRATGILDTRDSMKCINKPIIWIACSTSHDRDYSLIEKYVKYKIKSIVVFGNDGDDNVQQFSDMVENFVRLPNMFEAVVQAQKFAGSGDVILFSPSCASSGMFTNYAERGNVFKKIVSQLT